jgi:hypothetical protein
MCPHPFHRNGGNQTLRLLCSHHCKRSQSHPVGSIAAWFCSLTDSETNSTAVIVDSTRIYLIYIEKEKRVNIPQMIHVLKRFDWWWNTTCLLALKWTRRQQNILRSQMLSLMIAASGKWLRQYYTSHRLKNLHFITHKQHTDPNV